VSELHRPAVPDVVGIELAAFDDIADARRVRNAPVPEEALPVHTDIRPALHRAIDGMVDDLVTMAGLVVDALTACAAALRGEPVDCNAVIAGDDAVDDIHRRVRLSVISVLTTQAPLARDLRSALAALLVDEELERMGDHCAAIAGQCGHLAAAPRATREALGDLAERSAAQIHAVAEHVIHRDCNGARELAAAHEDLVTSYHDLVDRLLAGKDCGAAGPAIVLVAHHLERIGDRVTNVAEHLVFAVEGELVHLG
jgi:phosphate transport system protein